MPIDINAVIARKAREKDQTEFDVLDGRVAAVATVWLVLYCILMLHAVSNQTIAAAIELAARY